MKFFIDTANLAQIKEAHDLGILDGVTTNPSLMAKEGIKGEDAREMVILTFVLCKHFTPCNPCTNNVQPLCPSMCQ